MREVRGDWTTSMGKALGRYFTDKTGYPVSTSYTALGFLKDDIVKVVVLFTDYKGASCEVHIIGWDHLTRQVIRAAVNHVFNELKCCRATMITPRRDKHLTKYSCRIGFKYEATLKNLYGLSRQDDGLVYAMFRPEAEKWMSNGKPKRV